MRIAIISDIHGNLPALEAVLADVADQHPDAMAHHAAEQSVFAEPAKRAALRSGWQARTARARQPAEDERVSFRGSAGLELPAA
jgi:calcineurin-like phosphoesterase family protein